MKKIALTLSILLLTCHIMAQYEGGNQPRIKPGIEVLLTEQLDLVRGKRLGLLTNHSGIDSQFRSTIDLLNDSKDCTLVKLFCPEHGIRGELFAGEKKDDYLDPLTSITVHSLYGARRKPTPEMLSDIDALLYDIQDIGTRTYTYIYTMSYAMEACAEQKKPFIVLDRPNPMGGLLVDGMVLDEKFKSNLGRFPIPYVYGMTPGELATLFNQEFGIGCPLTVVKMNGWQRTMRFWDTGLPWVATSGGIPRPDSPFYNAMIGAIGELQTVNEGVGTTEPFEYIGAPWVNAYQLAQNLNAKNLPGIHFRPSFYTPRYYVFEGQHLNGVKIHITDFDKVKPYTACIHILETLIKLYPQNNIFANQKRLRMFDIVAGTDQLRLQLAAGKSAEEIIASWQPELQKFMQLRQKYLLYK